MKQHIGIAIVVLIGLGVFFITHPSRADRLERATLIGAFYKPVAVGITTVEPRFVRSVPFLQCEAWAALLQTHLQAREVALFQLIYGESESIVPVSYVICEKSSVEVPTTPTPPQIIERGAVCEFDYDPLGAGVVEQAEASCPTSP